MHSIIDFLLHCEKKGLISFTASIERIKFEILTEWIGGRPDKCTPRFDKVANVTEVDAKSQVDNFFIPESSKRSGLQFTNPPVRVERNSRARDVAQKASKKLSILPPGISSYEEHSGVSSCLSPTSLAPAPMALVEGNLSTTTRSSPLWPRLDEPSTQTSDGSEMEDPEYFIHLSTPELEFEAGEEHAPLELRKHTDHSPLELPSHSPCKHTDHSPLELPSHSPCKHTDHSPLELPSHSSYKKTSTPELPTSDTCSADLGPHNVPPLSSTAVSEPFSVSADVYAGVGTKVFAVTTMVTKLKFTPDSSPSPLAPNPLDHTSPPSPRNPPSCKDTRQSTGNSYKSDDESRGDDEDLEHILHRSTPDASTHLSPSSPPSSPPAVAPCGEDGCTQPVMAASLSSTSRCVTAVGGSWKVQSTEAFLNFSPDFGKLILHQSNSITQNVPVGQPDGPNAAPAGRLSSTADKENMRKDSTISHSCPHRPPLPAMSRSSRQGTDAVNSAPLDVSSDDDEANEKLENLFLDLRIHSAKKNSATRTVSRKSLEAFIVSDSDEGEDEENVEDHASTTPPTEHTPDGRAFVRHPFTERPQLSTPVCSSAQKIRHAHSSLALTPSAHKSFARNKDQMAMELYQLFNQTVFNNQLPEKMEIRWNRKLRTTAGYCYNSGSGSNRSSRIELSQKVCNSYDRIRETLIHEMCHAATWVISGVKKGGHGSQWQRWATMANQMYPSIGKIARCHNYDIDYKYTYKCTRCDFRHGRHSKSVDVEHKRCPRCLSVLQLEPKLNLDGTPASARKLTRYAKFIQDNYTDMKKAMPLGSHKEVMEALRGKYYAQQDGASQES